MHAHALAQLTTRIARTRIRETHPARVNSCLSERGVRGSGVSGEKYVGGGERGLRGRSLRCGGGEGKALPRLQLSFHLPY